MSIDIGQDEMTRAALRRGDLADSFAAAREWLAGDPAPRMDEQLVIQLHVPRGLDHAGKLAWLEGVAASWGVKTTSDDEDEDDEAGGRRAEKRFGALLFTACTGHPDRSHSGYMARADARRSAIAAHGATA